MDRAGSFTIYDQIKQNCRAIIAKTFYFIWVIIVRKLKKATYGFWIHNNTTLNSIKPLFATSLLDILRWKISVKPPSYVVEEWALGSRVMNFSTFWKDIKFLGLQSMNFYITYYKRYFSANILFRNEKKVTHLIFQIFGIF